MTNDQIRNLKREDMSIKNTSKNIQNCGKNVIVKSSNIISIPVQLILSIVFGIIFGFLMNKSNVYVAPVIRDQMLFKRLIMIKMFLGAVGMSMLSVVLIIIVNESIYLEVLNGFIQRNNRINGIDLVIGGSLIGVGMVVGGSCPGSIFVQIGSGLRNSVLTGVGGCCGVIFYYLFLHKHLRKSELPKSSIVLQEVPYLMGLKRIYLNLIIGLIFVSISFTIEYIVPYRHELIKSNVNILNGWSPSLCGIGIGLLQFFFMILFEKSFGVSSGFTVLAAQLCRIKLLKELIPSLESFTYGIQNNLTLLFTFGIIIGSFVSTYSRNEFPLNDEYGANVWNSFFGGFLLLVGARCAGGCTSGQGISGVTHLLIGSLIATAAMFGGGIVFAVSYGFITGDWQFDGL